jgi:hypothetical protein
MAKKSSHHLMKAGKKKHGGKRRGKGRGKKTITKA